MSEQDTTRHLNERQIETLRERLESERRRLLERSAEDDEREDELPVGEVEDMVDRAEESWDKEELFAAREEERQELLRIEEALGRLAKGSYGFCFYCGEPIAFARLESVPAARFCAEHQEQLEQGKIDETRPFDWPTSTAD